MSDALEKAKLLLREHFSTVSTDEFLRAYDAAETYSGPKLNSFLESSDQYFQGSIDGLIDTVLTYHVASAEQLMMSTIDSTEDYYEPWPDAFSATFKDVNLLGSESIVDSSRDCYEPLSHAISATCKAIDFIKLGTAMVNTKDLHDFSTDANVSESCNINVAA